MEDLVRVVLYGVLPSIAAGLLLVGAFGPRWLGLAAGIGLFVALGLLRNRLPAWPHALWAGNNDGNVWLVWCVLTAGVLSACSGRAFPPRWLAVPAGLAASVGQVWLMLSTRRPRLPTSESVLVHAAAVAACAAAWLSVRRAIEQRGGALLTWLLALCLVGDSALLIGSHSALQGQLAGAVAAAFGAAGGTAIWRHDFRLDRAVALPFAVSHCGLLLAGQQFSELPPLPAGLAALAPAWLALAGGRGEGAGSAGRLWFAVLLMAVTMGGAIAMVFGNGA